MDRFDDLETFIAVAELRSIRRAAERLERAPSAVSRRIQELEQRLRTPLFTRTTRQVVPTAAGERFFYRAQRILAELEEAEECAAADTNTISGELRLSLPLSFGLAHVTPLLCQFMLDNPLVTIDADLSDHTVDLVARRIDLAIRIGQLTDSTLRARRLAPINKVVAASPAFWQREGLPDMPEALNSLPALCYSNNTNPHIWPWKKSSGETGQSVLQTRYRASNGEALVLAARQGLGVVNMPTFLLNPAIEAGELQPALLSVNWGQSGLYAVYPDTTWMPARTRAFIDYIASQFTDTPSWDACLRTAQQS